MNTPTSPSPIAVKVVLCGAITDRRTACINLPALGTRHCIHHQDAADVAIRHAAQMQTAVATEKYYCVVICDRTKKQCNVPVGTAGAICHIHGGLKKNGQPANYHRKEAATTATTLPPCGARMSRGKVCDREGKTQYGGHCHYHAHVLSLPAVGLPPPSAGTTGTVFLPVAPAAPARFLPVAPAPPVAPALPSPLEKENSELKSELEAMKAQMQLILASMSVHPSDIPLPDADFSDHE